MATLVVLVVGGVSACTEDDPSPSTAADAGATTSQPVDKVEGFAVTGLADPANYRVTTRGKDEAGQNWMRPASSIFAIEPSGPLPNPVTVTITLDTPAPKDALILVGTRESDTESWTYLPATASDDRTTASVQVDHFSFFTSVVVLLKDIWKIFQEQFQEGLTAGLAQHIVKPESCQLV